LDAALDPASASFEPAGMFNDSLACRTDDRREAFAREPHIAASPLWSTKALVASIRLLELLNGIDEARHRDEAEKYDNRKNLRTDFISATWSRAWVGFGR
jgi:hypothetical protein